MKSHQLFFERTAGIIRIFIKTLLLLFFVYWLLEFYFVFNSTVVNTGISQVVQYSNQSVDQFKTIQFVTVSLVLFWAVYLWISRKSTLKQIFCEYAKTGFSFFILFAEVAIGAYIGAVIFVIEFSGYDPRFILILNGLVAFYILEKIKHSINIKFLYKPEIHAADKHESTVEKSLYIKILIWTYRRQENGFTWGELENEFLLTEEQKIWVMKVFRSNMPSSDNLIDHLAYYGGKDEHRFVITSKGTSDAIEYLNLKEAEKSGKRAETIAITAIVIGIVVGVAQIIFK